MASTSQARRLVLLVLVVLVTWLSSLVLRLVVRCTSSAGARPRSQRQSRWEQRQSYHQGDPEAMKAAAGTLDAVIDTVSATHDINAVIALMAPRGKYVMVGLPPEKPVLDNSALIMKCYTVAGSAIGNHARTQEMLEFCGEKNITADVEVIYIDHVNTAMDRMAKGDVKFRFVIDINKSLIL